MRFTGASYRKYGTWNVAVDASEFRHGPNNNTVILIQLSLMQFQTNMLTFANTTSDWS
jgi:hypothetical protein